MRHKTREITAKAAVFRHWWQALKVAGLIATAHQHPTTPQNWRYSFLYFVSYLWHFSEERKASRLCTPTHRTQRLGLGVLMRQPQPSFSISDRSCLMVEKGRQSASRIARQKMRTGCERHGERESERRRETVTKRGRTRKKIGCYQSEQ